MSDTCPFCHAPRATPPPLVRQCCADGRDFDRYKHRLAPEGASSSPPEPTLSIRRAAFEQWARANGFALDRSAIDYRTRDTRVAWAAWSAATS